MACADAQPRDQRRQDAVEAELAEQRAQRVARTEIHPPLAGEVGARGGGDRGAGVRRGGVSHARVRSAVELLPREHPDSEARPAVNDVHEELELLQLRRVRPRVRVYLSKDCVGLLALAVFRI